MNDFFSLKGKRVVVTGGTRGVGRAISLQFARAGAQVLANYVRDSKAADELQEVAAKEGITLETVRGDLTTEKGTNRLVEATVARFPSVTTFVHCAATGVHRPFPELTLRHFDWTYSLNVRAFSSYRTGFWIDLKRVPVFLECLLTVPCERFPTTRWWALPKGPLNPSSGIWPQNWPRARFASTPFRRGPY